MAKQRIFDLPVTKGSFQVAGIVSGTQKDNFFTEKKAKNGKDFRAVTFGVEVNEGSSVYLSLNGMEQDNVFYSKRGDKEKGIKPETESVPWRDRYNFSKEGFTLIGVRTGVKKVVNSKGEEVNDKKILAPFDATKEIADNLKDEASIFSRGEIEFSTYNGRHQQRFVPNQVSLCRPIDFKADDFKQNALWTQVIIFTGVKPTEDKTEFVVSAKIVTYNTIEDAEFYIDKEHEKLAQSLRKKVKPYTAMKAFGNISIIKNVEEIEVDDEWGDANQMELQKAPTIRKLYIDGVEPKSFDTNVYSEEKIAQALAKIAASNTAKSDFGDKPKATAAADDDWGSDSSFSVDDDELPW